MSLTRMPSMVRGHGSLEPFALGGFRFFNDVAGETTYSLRILHTNDHHAHIDPVIESNVSPPRNHGGLARRKTLIDQQRADARRRRLPVMLLDAGDVFQGTLFFGVYKGKADLDLYRRLRYHAMTIGNHEFDAGQQVLADFIKAAGDRDGEGMPFPVLSANIKADHGSPLAKRIRPRIIHRAGKERIGIFGVTTEETPDLSDLGPGISFTSAVEAAREQVAAFHKAGVNKIVALTHLGFGQDQRLAQSVDGLGLIIGGHSHTPLGPQPGSTHAYPTIETAPNGNPVMIVTNWEWGRWLGQLDIEFDSRGTVRSITGLPIEVQAHADGVMPDAEFERIIVGYRQGLDSLRNKIVGESTVALDGNTVNVRSHETNLGNLICDAMLWKTANDRSQIAIMNGGGIRTSINAGTISYGQVLEVLPFGSTIARVCLTGEQVLIALEHGVSHVGDTESTGRFAQVAGVRYRYTADKPAGQRLLSVEVKQGEGYAPLDRAATYNVMTNSFMLRGGDGYTMFADGTDQLDMGFVLADAVAEYIAAHSPVSPQVEGRIMADIQRALPIYLED